MSYNSGINQQIRNQIFYDNYSAINQPLTQTNLSLIANLKYVQDWVSQTLKPFMTIINPYFTGLMTGSNITLSGYLSVPTIDNITNFQDIPTIEIDSIKYNVSSIPSGNIKMFISNINIPSGFLLCDGSSYLIADYPNLYSSIGITYGGNGTTNFNVPNFQSYFPIGGNNQNSLGCSTSNFVSGNNTSGATNTYSTYSNFGGSTSSVAPLLNLVPQHTHTIQDNGHSHDLFLETAEVPYITIPPIGQYIVNQTGSAGLSSLSSNANVEIGQGGDNVQITDSVSNLNGVNICPPYVSVFFYISI